MTHEERAAYVNAQTALFRCEVEGMIAENNYRMARGETIAYAEEAFEILRLKWETNIGHNALVTFFQD